MANGHGGSRTPSSPAPVSGPGALSKRTDGGPGAKQPVRMPTGGAYGDASALQATQQGAPMAASPGGDQPAHSLLAGMSLPQGPAFGEATQQPGVPVTAGAASGPGPGPEAMGLPAQEDQDLQAQVRYLPVYEHMANIPGASSAMRNLVRDLKGRAG